MRKLAALAIALAVITMSAGVYACGDENSKAKKVDASKAEAKATQASVKVMDANVEQARYMGETKSCSAFKEARAAKADLMVKSTDVKVRSAGSACPASMTCPAPCKGMAKEAKAEIVDASNASEAVTMIPEVKEKAR